MAFLTQQMNQFTNAAILGMVDQIPTPDVVSAQINPASAASSIQVGDPVKLITGTSGAILVDKGTGPADTVKVFGIIPYNERKNIYVAGDIIEVACGGSYVYCKTSAAVVRGTNVSTTGSTTTADPTVATDVTSGHQITGVAIDEASGANQLIRVKITPSTLP